MTPVEAKQYESNMRNPAGTFAVEGLTLNIDRKTLLEASIRSVDDESALFDVICDNVLCRGMKRRYLVTQ